MGLLPVSLGESVSIDVDALDNRAQVLISSTHGASYERWNFDPVLDVVRRSERFIAAVLDSDVDLCAQYGLSTAVKTVRYYAHEFTV